MIEVMYHCSVVDQFTGLSYETVRRQPGPSDAERKLDELTRQLQVEMRLDPSPPSQQSPSLSGLPSKTDGYSLPSSLQRAKHSDQYECPSSCGMCHM